MKKQPWKALRFVLAGFAFALGCLTAEPGKAGEIICPNVSVQVAMQPNESIGKATENLDMGEVKSGKADAADQFDVAVGQEFTLTLASNPTTGYHWELAAPPADAIVQLVASEYKAPETQLLGTGGQEIWTFRAVGQGQTVIELKYVRPWEKDAAPIKTASYKVIVR